MTPKHCPTCGSVVEVVTADEGTSSYRPVVLTDEMVERAAEAIAAEFRYAPPNDEEMYDAAYWKWIARRALEAGLGGAA